MDFLGSYVADANSPAAKTSKMNVSHFPSPAGSGQPRSFREENGTGSPHSAMKIQVPPLSEDGDFDICQVPTVASENLTPMTGRKGLWECDTPTGMMENLSTVFLTPRAPAIKKTQAAATEGKNPTEKQNVDSGPLQGLMGLFKPSN